MSVLIKGMDMPAKGEYELLLFCHSDGTANLEGFCTVFEGEPFEVVEVPTPHGRLKDEQELIKAINEKVDNVSENRGRGATIPSIAWFSGVSSALSIIEAAPTIIEAEEGEEA